MRFFFFLIFVLIFQISTYSQDRFALLEHKLDSISTSMDGLKTNVELSVSNITIPDFIRSIAQNNHMNITIDLYNI